MLADIRQCRICGAYHGAEPHECAPDAPIKRVSIREDDPGYSPLAFCVEVFLDGAPLQWCITADAERGEALVYDADADFSFRQTKTVRGRVEIRRVRG